MLTRAETKQLTKALGKIVNRVKKGDITIYQAQRIIDSYGLSEKVYNIAANAAILGSAIEVYMSNRNNREVINKVRPVIGNLERSPKKTADKMVKIAEKSEDSKQPKWMEETVLYLASGVGNDLRKEYKKKFKQNQKYANRTIAQQVNKDLAKFKKKERAEIADRINKKWRKPTTIIVDGKKTKGTMAEAYSRRNIESQVHNQTEAVKATDAFKKGLRFKQWITQQDERVRVSHKVLDGQTIPVDEDFNVSGNSASYPGDPRLPIGEKINCRCKLRYKNDLF